jgi:hypothetical protein
MKLLQIVQWAFSYNDDYIVDIVINKGIIEAWLYKADCGIKEFLFGVDVKNTSFDNFVYMTKNYIEENNSIQFYEDEYVID